MPSGRIIQRSWAAGELCPRLAERFDLEDLHKIGALRLLNCYVQPQGGIAPMPGCTFVDRRAGALRLVPFTFAAGGFVYLIVAFDGQFEIWRDGALRATVVTPYTADDVPDLYWTQLNDVLILTAPNHWPKLLTRVGDTDWTLTDLAWAVADNKRVEAPFWRFEPTITMKPTAKTVGQTTLTASADWFTDERVGQQLRVQNRGVRIDAVLTARTATVTLFEELPNTDATYSWEEELFTAARGYPRVVHWFQQRLVLCANEAMPNVVVFSQPDDLYNFKAKDADGVVTESHAIRAQIFAQTFQTIQAVETRQSELLFKTSGGLWRAQAPSRTGAFGPRNFELTELHNKAAGLRDDRLVVAGAAGLYLSADGRTLYQNALEVASSRATESLTTRNVSLTFEHRMRSPGAQLVKLDRPYSALVIRHEDGTLTVVSYAQEQNVVAPTEVDYGFTIIDMAVVDDTVSRLFLLGADGTICEVDGYIEFADERDLNGLLSRSVAGTSENGATVWGGLAHFDDGTVLAARADGIPRTGLVVTNGTVTLPKSAVNCVIGAPMERRIRFMPLVSHNGVDDEVNSHTLAASRFKFVETEVRMVTYNGQEDYIHPIRFTDVVEERDFEWTALPEMAGVRELLEPELVINEPSPFVLSGVAHVVRYGGPFGVGSGSDR